MQELIDAINKNRKAKIELLELHNLRIDICKKLLKNTITMTMTEQDLEKLLKLLAQRKSDEPLYEFDTLIDFGIECYNQALKNNNQKPKSKEEILKKLNID